ncbi:response regulator [Aquabacter cavernae]|uniref:response regulator n=1 Tax=Aquabacter cavernae TaxID=2496029 RepID=UPI000F8D4786|nr:response regulator [Aquabacter cavernae]
MSARILVVEDDPLEADRLLSALACLGHSCVLAVDGDDALRRLEGEPFDAVLLDLVLPGLDGMGVLRAMQARGLCVPVVAAVTHSGVDAVDSALNAGARDFVVKPAGALRLKVSIANALAFGRIAREGVEPSRADNVIAFPAVPELAPEPEANLPLLDRSGHARSLAQLERDVIAAAVSLYGGRMSEVARRLGIGRSTLYRRLGELGLSFGEPVAELSVAAE